MQISLIQTGLIRVKNKGKICCKNPRVLPPIFTVNSTTDFSNGNICRVNIPLVADLLRICDVDSTPEIHSKLPCSMRGRGFEKSTPFTCSRFFLHGETSMLTLFQIQYMLISLRKCRRFSPRISPLQSIFCCGISTVANV